MCRCKRSPSTRFRRFIFFSQMSMNVPAVYTTATSQLHVRTQQDPTLARVTLLTQGMEKAALGTQVTV